MKERKYQKPPIIEVVCEFRFDPSSKWDATVPGRIYEQLKKDFPKKRRIQRLGVTVQQQPETSLQVQYEEGMRFLRKDELAFIQVQPHRISVHHLAPYPHWERFKPLIKKGYRAYLKIFPKPKLQRIGLRYINRIVLPDDHRTLDEFFTLYPSVGRPLFQDYKAFAVYLLLSFENGRDALHLRLASEGVEDEEQLAVLLDLDYFLANPGSVPTSKTLEWVEQAHYRILEVFEEVITDSLRKQFGEEGGE